MAGRQRGNGMGSITSYKTSKGKTKYRVRISVGTYLDEDSCKLKTISKSLGSFDRRADAEAALVAFNNSPYDLTTKVKTVGDLYKEWSSYYFEKLKSDSSIRTVTCAWKYCTSIENLPLKSLNKGHIEDVMDKGYILDKLGSKRFASVNTKCRIKSIFNLMLDYAYDRNLVVKNVARQFDINDMRTEADYQKKIKQPFTQEQIELLWSEVDELPYVDMILIGNYSGFRPQELCLLKIENVSLEDNIIVGGMKTRAGINRKVPIHPLIKPLVEKRYNQAIKLGSEWLFNDRHSQTGLNITYDKFRHHFETVMAELGIKDITGHCMRVTFITKAYDAGMQESIIKRIVGHALTNNITESVYNRVTPEDLYNEIFKIIR